jgi:hypothetical protein
VPPCSCVAPAVVPAIAARVHSSDDDDDDVNEVRADTVAMAVRSGGAVMKV